MKNVPILVQDMIVPYLCCNPGAETIGSNLIREFILPDIDYEREIIQTPDGGALALDWLRSKVLALPDKPIALFIHGYVGNSQADYIKLLLPEVRDLFRVVSLNYRGRGGVKLASPQMFNPTDSSDLKIILEHIQGKFPVANIFAIAFSLGGSIAIQYLVRAKVRDFHQTISYSCHLYRRKVTKRKLILSLQSHHQQVEKPSWNHYHRIRSMNGYQSTWLPILLHMSRKIWT